MLTTLARYGGACVAGLAVFLALTAGDAAPALQGYPTTGGGGYPSWARRAFVPLAPRNDLAVGYPMPWATATAAARMTATATVTSGTPSPTSVTTPTPTAPSKPGSTATPTSVPIVTSTPTPQAVTFRLANSSDRWSGNYHYIYGRLTNDGSATAYSPEVTVTYYNAAGALAGVEKSSTNLRAVRAGRSTNFYTLGQPAADATRYVVTVSSEAPSDYLTYHHDGLDVSASRVYRTSSVVYVVGQITNNTGRTFNAAYFDVGVYDATGKILEAGRMYPWSANSVAPGSTSALSASFYDSANRIPSNATYTIEGEGYVFGYGAQEERRGPEVEVFRAPLIRP